jgi:hypothetical protein
MRSGAYKCAARNPGHDREPGFVAREDIAPKDKALPFPPHENHRSRILGLDKLHRWNFLGGGSGAEGRKCTQRLVVPFEIRIAA